ncbi:hypothetical protein M0R45_003879 [Rubus argutus]|uniref:F-box domain-containing protein n=1 Tax=Rubus argutus TaxID=59490 RepID=A0AAW1YIF1_RUBAR
MQRPKVRWCDLPKELWQMIGKLLESRIDVLRFRSVCSLWRSAIPALEQTATPPLPLRFPHSGAEPPAVIFQNTVYRMQSLIDDDPNDSQPCLVKFEESNSGEMRLLHPITNWQVRYSITPSIKEFNLLDFRIVELAKLYTLKYAYTKIDVTYVNKVVVVPCNRVNLGEDFLIL